MWLLSLVTVDLYSWTVIFLSSTFFFKISTLVSKVFLPILIILAFLYLILTRISTPLSSVIVPSSIWILTSFFFSSYSYLVITTFFSRLITDVQNFALVILFSTTIFSIFFFATSKLVLLILVIGATLNFIFSTVVLQTCFVISLLTTQVLRLTTFFMQDFLEISTLSIFYLICSLYLIGVISPYYILIFKPLASALNSALVISVLVLTLSMAILYYFSVIFPTFTLTSRIFLTPSAYVLVILISGLTTFSSSLIFLTTST